MLGRHIQLISVVSAIRKRAQDQPFQSVDQRIRHSRLLARERLAATLPSRHGRRLRVQLRCSACSPSCHSRPSAKREGKGTQVAEHSLFAASGHRRRHCAGKQLKRWNRVRKIKLIEKTNSGWNDLYERMLGEICLPDLPGSPSPSPPSPRLRRARPRMTGGMGDGRAELPPIWGRRDEGPHIGQAGFRAKV